VDFLELFQKFKSYYSEPRVNMTAIKRICDKAEGEFKTKPLHKSSILKMISGGKKTLGIGR
jgi:hypothetical protein